jgi:hypothetical protein
MRNSDFPIAPMMGAFLVAVLSSLLIVGSATAIA